jgi:hypothetical protein
MKSKPHIPTFSAENAMPPNYAHDLVERVLLRHGANQPVSFYQKPYSFTLFGAAAAIFVLLGAFNFWMLMGEQPPVGEAIPKQVVEAYLWNEEHVTEADLLLILTGEEADETLNYGLESDPFVF